MTAGGSHHASLAGLGRFYDPMRHVYIVSWNLWKPGKESKTSCGLHQAPLQASRLRNPCPIFTSTLTFDGLRLADAHGAGMGGQRAS